MKSYRPIFSLLIMLLAAGKLRAQTVDTLFFNLYTDSLKKGTYNYINVDGKLSNGQWVPLTDKQLKFSASAGTFKGNSLFVDTSFKGEKVTVKIVLKDNPSVTREMIIYIKKYIPNERLKTVDEILGEPPRRRRRG